MPHHPPSRKRLLLIDGNPGATTLLLLAAHGAIPAFDAVLAPYTGWFPNQTLDHLDLLGRIATGVGMDWVRAETEDTAQESLDGARLTIQLTTLTTDYVADSMPHGHTPIYAS